MNHLTYLQKRFSELEDSLNPEQFEKLSDFCFENHIELGFLEDLSDCDARNILEN